MQCPSVGILCCSTPFEESLKEKGRLLSEKSRFKKDEPLDEDRDLPPRSQWHRLRWEFGYRDIIWVLNRISLCWKSWDRVTLTYSETVSWSQYAHCERGCLYCWLSVSWSVTFAQEIRSWYIRLKLLWLRSQRARCLTPYSMQNPLRWDKGPSFVC